MINYVILIISVLISLGFWFSIYKINSKKHIKDNSILMLIVSIGFMVRLSYLIVTPSFYAPDEQSHLNYVKYLSENNNLPVQTSKTNDESNVWEYYQPPLYYFSLLPIYKISYNFFNNFDLSIKIIRFGSLIYWIILVFFTFKIIKVLPINDNFIRVSIISFVSLLPTYSYSSAMINNDNLLIAIGAIILYFSIKKISWKNTTIIGILLGFAMLSKLSGVIFFIYFIIFYAINLIYKRIEFKNILNLIVMLLMGFLIWLPIGLWNYNVYGSFTAEEIANIPYQWESITQALFGTAIYLQKSFWAISGIHNNISSYFPVVGMILTIFALYGLIKNFISNKSLLSIRTNYYEGIFSIFLLTVVILIGLIFRFGILYAQSQGRFLYPLLMPISIIFGLGLKYFKISNYDNSHIHFAGIFILYSFTFFAYSYINF